MKNYERKKYTVAYPVFTIPFWNSGNSRKEEIGLRRRSHQKTNRGNSRSWQPAQDFRPKENTFVHSADGFWDPLCVRYWIPPGLTFLWGKEMEWGTEWWGQLIHRTSQGDKGKSPSHIKSLTIPRCRGLKKPLRVSKEGGRTYKVTRTRLVSPFSLTTCNARGLWRNKSKSVKKHDFQPRILCPAKQSSAEAEKAHLQSWAQKGTLSHVSFLSKLF